MLFFLYRLSATEAISENTSNNRENYHDNYNDNKTTSPDSIFLFVKSIDQFVAFSPIFLRQTLVFKINEDK